MDESQKEMRNGQDGERRKERSASQNAAFNRNKNTEIEYIDMLAYLLDSS